MKQLRQHSPLSTQYPAISLCVSLPSVLGNQFSRVVTEHSLCSCRAQTECHTEHPATHKGLPSTVCQVSAFLCISPVLSPRNKSHACWGRRGGKNRKKKKPRASYTVRPSIGRPAVEFQAALQTRPPLLAFIPSRRYNGDKNPPMARCRYPASVPDSRPLAADWPKIESNNNQRVQ